MNANRLGLRLTALLAIELVGLPVGADCCRRAEAAALVQSVQAGVVPAGPAEDRLLCLYGDVPRSRLPGVLGLRDRSGRWWPGLPAGLVAAAGDCCLSAVLRGAVLGCGVLQPRPGRVGVCLGLPDPVVAVAVAGAAGRLGVTGRLYPAGAGEQLRIRDAGALLAGFPAPRTLTAWAHHDPGPRRDLAHWPGGVAANTRRAATAATGTVARLQRLLDDGHPVPDGLAGLVRLRLRHPEDSLAELGARHDPPLTKDTVAGRLHRLLRAYQRMPGVRQPAPPEGSSPAGAGR